MLPVSMVDESPSPVQLLEQREPAEVDLLRCEISHVLASLDAPYLDQYTPAEVAGPAVALAVTAFVESSDAVVPEASGEPRVEVVAKPIDEQLDSLVVSAPAPLESDPRTAGGIRSARLGIDYARRDTENRALGRAGEEFVLEFERLRLEAAGSSDLAAKVEWVAQTKGDGLGYDISSFSNDGSPRYIEVKTTNGSINTPYHVTINEVEVSRRESAHYYLYRIFAFGTRRRLYQLEGALEQNSQLKPVSFLGRPR